MLSHPSASPVQKSIASGFAPVDGLSQAQWLVSLQALYDLGMSDAAIAAYFNMPDCLPTPDRLDQM